MGAQQGNGADRPLCPHETPFGLPHPGLTSPIQERYRAVEVGPEEGYKDDERDGAPFL